MGNTFGSIWLLSPAWYIDVWWIFKFGDNPLMILDSSFCYASDIHTGAYFLFALRSLVVVRLCGYPWSWLLRCLIDVSRWLIDDDRWLASDVIFFVVYQISILGHISPFSLSILGIEVATSLISVWALVWDFQWFMISEPSYTVLVR